MVLENTRFGRIEFEKSDIILMVQGFLGFEDLKRFIMVSIEGQEPFKWFQSLEDQSIAFLMIDPLFFKPDYVVEVHPKDLKLLGADDIEDVTVFVLVTIPEGKPERMSANMQAPLAINTGKKYAVQLILGDSDYKVEHSIFREIENRLTEAAS